MLYICLFINGYYIGETRVVTKSVNHNIKPTDYAASHIVPDVNAKGFFSGYLFRFFQPIKPVVTLAMNLDVLQYSLECSVSRFLLIYK